MGPIFSLRCFPLAFGRRQLVQLSAVDQYVEVMGDEPQVLLVLVEEALILGPGE